MTTTIVRSQALARSDDAALIGALITGVIGAFFGFAAFLTVVLGDDMIALDATSIGAVGVAVFGLIAAVFVRELPGFGAFGMATAPVAYFASFGAKWSVWWATYQEAVATSGAAENMFWSAMPAMAIFALSGAFLAVGAVLAAVDALSHSEA